MEHEIYQIKSDISELKAHVTNLEANVSSIKSDISDMKMTVSNAMEKISDSSVRMATILEKLNHNVEEHKTIHKRIDEFKDAQDYFDEDLAKLKTTHRICMEGKKIKEEQEKVSENAPWVRAKDKMIEYFFVILMCLILFTLYKNLEPFLNIMYKAEPNSTMIGATPHVK
jgi:chromosome segregation ATPase